MSELSVWIAAQRVGALVRKPNGNLQFRYASGYRGPPLSQSLPVQDSAHGNRVVRAFFGGLLPEQDVRAALAQNLGVSAGNDYALLDAVGGDVAGAIILLGADEEPPAVPTTEPLSPGTLSQLLQQLPQRPLGSGGDEGIRLSLAGAQPKVPVIVADDGTMALPTNSAAPTTHILKPEPIRFPGLVDNEAFCMSLARACELSVARVSKSQTVAGLPFLVVERYDRDLTVDPIRRLHQEDFCQALGVPAERKYQNEGGPTFAQAAQLVRECTPAPAQELPRLLRALIFSWIVGNCDAHGKNYSLLYDQGAPTLAPLYDLVSTSIYPAISRRLAMRVGPAVNIDDVDADAWSKLADAARYRPAFVRATVADLTELVAHQSAALVAQAGHSNETARQIDSRIQDLARSG
jgi:serine/threonine-protein kinase HipA